MKQSCFSISIDDGHPLDLKAAGILAKKNIKTTFYIPIKNSTGRPTLNRKQIKWLSQQPNFEIGGHTHNHIDLTKVSLENAEEEMSTGKEALEDIIGKQVSTFAWPWGRYNKNLLNIARNMGFKDCRSATTLNLNPTNINRGFLWHPNLHIYPHPWYRGLISSLFRGDIKTFCIRLTYLRDRYIELIPHMKQEGVLFHLWFHSWEIEQLGVWDYITDL